MAVTDKRLLRFVRALLAGVTAERLGDDFIVAQAGRPLKLPAAMVAELISRGALAGDDTACRTTPETLAWLKRQMLPDEPYARQHRLSAIGRDGEELNLAESPLMRLARPEGGDGTAYLTGSEVEAGERLRRLIDRAHLMPRLTMSYSARVSEGGGKGRAADVGEMAIDARRRLDAIARELPADCYGVAVDVCGFLKGLQQVEAERRWPKRSARLVLRIALQQLARHFGIGEVAEGATTRRSHRWLEEGARPTVFE